MVLADVRLRLGVPLPGVEAGVGARSAVIFSQQPGIVRMVRLVEVSADMCCAATRVECVIDGVRRRCLARARLTADEDNHRPFLVGRTSEPFRNDLVVEDLGVHPVRKLVAFQILDLAHRSLVSSRSRRPKCVMAAATASRSSARSD